MFSTGSAFKHCVTNWKFEFLYSRERGFYCENRAPTNCPWLVETWRAAGAADGGGACGGSHRGGSPRRRGEAPDQAPAADTDSRTTSTPSFRAPKPAEGGASARCHGWMMEVRGSRFCCCLFHLPGLRATEHARAPNQNGVWLMI